MQVNIYIPNKIHLLKLTLDILSLKTSQTSTFCIAKNKHQKGTCQPALYYTTATTTIKGHKPLRTRILDKFQNKLHLHQTIATKS